jgi:hypothetical protein
MAKSVEDVVHRDIHDPYLKATTTVDNPVSTKARTTDKVPCTLILNSSLVDPK